MEYEIEEKLGKWIIVQTEQPFEAKVREEIKPTLRNRESASIANLSIAGGVGRTSNSGRNGREQGKVARPDFASDCGEVDFLLRFYWNRMSHFFPAEM
jgi:hypothetical protein